jgi:hypothetical protein
MVRRNNMKAGLNSIKRHAYSASILIGLGTLVAVLGAPVKWW